jgi:hypothetical protein
MRPSPIARAGDGAIVGGRRVWKRASLAQSGQKVKARPGAAGAAIAHLGSSLLLGHAPRGTPVLSCRSLLRLGAAARAIRRADRGGEHPTEAAPRRAAGEGTAVRGGRRRRVMAGGCGCVRVFSAYRRAAVPRVLLKNTLSNQKEKEKEGNQVK